MGATIQTGIRLSQSLYERLKRNAKREKRSLNSYITSILESATEPVFPNLDPAAFEPDEDIRRLGQTLGDIPQEKIEHDPRLKSILAQ